MTNVGFGIFVGLVSLLFCHDNASAQDRSVTLYEKVAACAAGAKIQMSFDMQGSLRDLFAGDGGQGKADIDTQTEYLKLFAEKDRLAAIRLYTECLSRLTNLPSSPRTDLAPSGTKNFTLNQQFLRGLEGVWVGTLACGSKGWQTKFTTESAQGHTIRGVYEFSGTNRRRVKASMTVVPTANEMKVNFITDTSSVYDFSGYIDRNGNIRLKTNARVCRGEEMILSKMRQ